MRIIKYSLFLTVVILVPSLIRFMEDRTTTTEVEQTHFVTRGGSFFIVKEPPTLQELERKTDSLLCLANQLKIKIDLLELKEQQ